MSKRSASLRAAASRSRTAISGARTSLARALASEGDTSQELESATGALAPHERVRSTISTWIRVRCPEVSDVAPCLALSTHPWPDLDLREELLLEVMDQLQPVHNMDHPDPREVAADRLYRIAEVLHQPGGIGEVADECCAAAARLADAVANDEIRALSPIALVIQAPAEVSPNPEHEEVPRTILSPRPNIVAHDLAAAAVEAVCRTGSLDIGDNMGVATSGVGLDVVLRSVLGQNSLDGFDRWISELEPRVATLLERRVFAGQSRVTLEEVGEEWGLTRERVRQVEAKVRESIDRTFGPALTAAASPLQRAANYVLPVETLDLLMNLVTRGLVHQSTISGVLRQYCGPWIRDREWVYHESARERLEAARASVRSSADDYGLLTPDAPSQLDGLFASEDDQLRFFRSALGLVQLCGFWSARDSLRARIPAALRHIGRPATKAEIAAVAGLDAEARIGSTLSALEGVVRADKERWAFAEWVDDPYDGIVGEINQRLDEHSGSMAIASLLDELPRKFGVSEVSVMTYLQTPAYVVEEGFVRYAEAGAFDAAPPSKWADAFHVDGLWGQQMQVEQRHFDGYSLKVRFDIAYANGLRPGCNLRVPIAGTDRQGSVIWRAHDATFSIDVGRVSEALADLGFAVGALILVLPSPEGVRVRRPLEAVETTQDSRVEHSDPLFDLLSGEP